MRLGWQRAWVQAEGGSSVQKVEVTTLGDWMGQGGREVSKETPWFLAWVIGWVGLAVIQKRNT